MANTVAEELKMVIKADVKEAKKALDDIEESIDSFSDSAENAGEKADGLKESSKKMGKELDESKDSSDGLTKSLIQQAAQYIAVGAAISSFISYTKEAIEDAEEENRGLMRLQSTLIATGRQYDITIGQIDKAASVLEDTVYADKQAIMDAAAQLAIMEGISSSLFNRIFDTASDLSVVMQTDIGSAAIDLGRALEDPIEGMTKLRRQGIFLSSETESQVASLVEQNSLYEAQLLVLDEIDKKVKGTAENVASVSANLALQTAWDKAKGSFGQLANDSLSGAKLLLADILNLADELNSSGIRENILRETSIEDAMQMNYAEFMDFMDMVNEAIESQDNFWIKNSKGVIEKWTDALPFLEQRKKIFEEEAAYHEKLSEEEKKRLDAEKERQKLLQEETASTEALLSLYSATDTGHLELLKSEIEALEQSFEKDKSLLESLKNSPDADNGLIAIIEERIPLYEAIIKARQEELANLAELGLDEDKSLVEKVLGSSAGDFAMDIPISFDFGRTELETVEEQMGVLKSAIDSLWEQKPDENIEEWEEAISILYGKYTELKEKAEEIRQEDEKSQELSRLKEEAQEELLKLKSEEERNAIALLEYEAKLQALKENGLITQEEMNALAEQYKQSLGESDKELSTWDRQMNALNEEWDKFVNNSLSAERIASMLTDVFASMGDAFGSGASMGEAALDVFGDFAQQITKEMSQMLITAGLRVIIEGGLPGLPLGLALIAAGGLTGFASGLMGSSSAALDESIMQEMQDEMEARKKLSDTINASIDTEYELLKRQLDRNLISEEEFASGAGTLQHQRDVADARTELSNSIYDKIDSLNSEYSGMSGWDKFWSGRDESIKDDISELQEYFDMIENATEEELRNLVDTLKDMGVRVGNVPKFATGGDFITTGPRLIMVGDNPGGRERVSITPLSSGAMDIPQSGNTVIQIQGDVYGWEDMYQKLQLAGIKIERRRA